MWSGISGEPSGSGARSGCRSSRRTVSPRAKFIARLEYHRGMMVGLPFTGEVDARLSTAAIRQCHSVDQPVDLDVQAGRQRGGQFQSRKPEPDLLGGGTRATLAITFTDIKDSTQLAHELGDEAMREVQRAHFAQSTRLIADNDGRRIKGLGDGDMAVFKNV